MLHKEEEEEALQVAIRILILILILEIFILGGREGGGVGAGITFPPLNCLYSNNTPPLHIRVY